MRGRRRRNEDKGSNYMGCFVIGQYKILTINGQIKRKYMTVSTSTGDSTP